MRKKQRFIAGAGLAAGLVAGGGAGLVIGAASGSAGAAGPVTAAITEPDPPALPAARGQRIRDLLQPLVDDGTITAAQLDAIVAQLATAEPGRGPGGPGTDGGGHRRWRLAVDLDTVATALGMTPDEVRSALRDGTTLKALAESKGKTAQDVIDALVAVTTTRLDQLVAGGELTQAEADARLAEATTRITDLVNDGSPARFPGGPGHGHHRGTEPDGTPAADDTPAPSSPTSTPSSTPPTTTG